MTDAWLSEPAADWWETFDVEEDWQVEALNSLEEQVRLLKQELISPKEPSRLSWADHQFEDMLPLFSAAPQLDGLNESSPTEGLEHIFAASYSPEPLGASPARSAFKDSFYLRPPSPTLDKADYSLLTATAREASVTSACSTCTLQKSTDIGLAESLALAAEESADSLACHTQANAHPSREAGGMDDGSGNPMITYGIDGLVDMDLQCKGEALSLECEEDQPPASALSWLVCHLPGPEVKDAIYGDSVLSPPTRVMTEANSDESANELEDSRPAQIILRLPKMISLSALSLCRTESSSTPETSVLGPSRSGNSIERDGPESELAAAATSKSGLSDGPYVRKRSGRPKRQAALAAKDATQMACGKRKRATTCKPAAPLVSGQACTQCSTHITPVWRAGPEGPKTLCNACGVRYMKVAKKK